MNHKRKRPKNARAGCLLCKPHKGNGAKNRDCVAVVRRTQRERDERREVPNDTRAAMLDDELPWFDTVAALIVDLSD